MKPLYICYPKCSTCKKAQTWLESQGVDFELRDIVKANPSREELEGWIERSELPISRFFNTSGILYREMNLKDRVKNDSHDELLTLLATNGMIVKRPLLVTDKGVWAGFKEDKWSKLL